MKGISKTSALLLAVISLQGCLSQARISALPTQDQDSIYKNGRETLISIKKHTVAVAPAASTVEEGHRSDFVVTIKNGSSENILFSTENISAYITSKGQKDSLYVFNYEELIEEEKDRQAWAKFGAALQAAADSVNAANSGYSNTYGTHTASAYSGGASAHAYGSSYSTTYNYSAAQAAQATANANSEARLAKLKSEGEQKLKELSSSILKKETVFPGVWYGGIVRLDMIKITDQSKEINLVIDVAGETHQFNFSHTKVLEK